MARKARPLSSWLTPDRKNEFWGIFLFTASLLLLASLVSFQPDDLGFFTSRPSGETRNLCGIVGAFVAGIVRSAMGLTGYVLVLLGFLWAFARFNGKPPQRPTLKLVSTILLCISVSSLLCVLWIHAPSDVRFQKGGAIGLLVGNRAVHYFGLWGGVVVLLSLSLLCFLLATELALWPVVSGSATWCARVGRAAVPALKQFFSVGLQALPKKEKAPLFHRKPSTVTRAPQPSSEPVIKVLTKKSAPEPAKPAPAAAPSVARLLPKAKPVPDAPERAPETGEGPFQLPSLELLNPSVGSSQSASDMKEWLEKNAKILEDSLRDFGIDAKVAQVEQGPVITRYEVEPAAGVKVQKITTLADDLALVMRAPSVRIIAPIPGKARVGIEVPNPASTLVFLREVLESQEFKDSSSRLALAIGKDAAGQPLVSDLGEMPHLLIAGATGSGKTVCMNALITAILFRATPEEVRFLMVDPKMVELSVFNGIPHLILPVVTNPKHVPAALHWVVQEMETRYRLFAKLGVRNIEGYLDKRSRGELPSEEIPENLPYLVVIIDELADLMLTSAAEVEKTIARLAHLSRAVGIHMVLATQRPSVDVLTGVIKANFPARISFQVASKVDSRTVLDAIGAEKLLGKGDLLFMQPGASKFIRAQGTLVTDEEIERVVAFLKAQRTAHYDTSILEEVSETKGLESVPQIKDALYPEAVRVVVETGQASVSLLQRRMRLGYGRAARILDQMEEEGIVGPIRGAKPREVFLKEIPDELIDRRETPVRA